MTWLAFLPGFVVCLFEVYCNRCHDIRRFQGSHQLLWSVKKLFLVWQSIMHSVVVFFLGYLGGGERMELCHTLHRKVTHGICRLGEFSITRLKQISQNLVWVPSMENMIDICLHRNRKTSGNGRCTVKEILYAIGDIIRLMLPLQYCCSVY